MNNRYYIASHVGLDGPVLFRDKEGSLIINERICLDEDDARRALTVTMRVKPKQGEAWRTHDPEQEAFAIGLVNLLNTANP